MLKVHLPTTSYFSKGKLLYLSNVLNFELSSFQKDVENSYIDVFQLFERRISLSFESFWKFNFRIFKKMSKTHISTSFNFSKDGFLYLSKAFENSTFEFSKRCQKLIYRRLSNLRKTDLVSFKSFEIYELSIIQKDVENSYIDVFQIFERYGAKKNFCDTVP